MAFQAIAKCELAIKLVTIMQKSIQINFHLPQALIDGLDEYLSKNEIDIGRSALLKFCLTYKPKLTLAQKQESVRLQDDLFRRSAQLANVSLRCHWEMSNGSDNISKICDTLTYLNLDKIFEN